jgi:hypothetical protein
MFVSRVARALMCVGVLVVLLGATPSGPSVTIADGALTPPVVAVLAGGSVLWTNQGTRQHEITAAGDAFPHFSLAPEGTRSVAFMKPGRYPYLLDGAVKGMVVVVVAGGGGGGPGGPGGGGQSSTPPPDCLTIYRYDVRVAVHREATMPSGLGRSGPVYEGTIKTVSDWKARWVAPVYLDRCAGVKLQITARPAAMSGNKGSPISLPGGQFDRTFDWNDTTKLTGYTEKLTANDTTKLYDVPPCHYTYASNVPAVMWVTALFGDLSANPEHKSFDFLAGQDFSDQTASKADFEHQAEARRAACDLKRQGITFHYTTIGDAGMPLDGFNGMIIGDNQLHLTFATPPNSPVDTPILDALAAGKGFNYDTGMQMYQDKGGTSSRVRATVSFSRLED